MIIEIKDRYAWGEPKWTGKTVDWLRENCPDFKEEKKDEPGKDGEDRYSYDFRFIGHVDEVPAHVLNFDKMEMVFFDRSLKAMVKDDAKVSAKNLHGQEVINIHLPSLELLSLDEVTWIEDACTEELQGELDRGFRIVACIPRPGQRRPDYVLGRNKSRVES